MKKKKSSLLDRLLGEEEEDKSSISEEVVNYFKERPIKRTDDPFKWWRSNGPRYPRLAVLARRYLSIPATSTKSERVYSVAGIVVDKRRCALTPEMINTLVIFAEKQFFTWDNQLSSRTTNTKIDFED